MNIIQPCVDFSASIVENLLILGFICRIAGRKYSQRIHVVCLLSLAVFLTIIVTILNSHVTFSFYTIYIGVFLIIFTTRYLSTGSLLIRTTACILAFFFLHTLDYVIGFLTSIFLAPSPEDLYASFSVLLVPGTIRIAFTLVNKTIQTALFFLLSSFYVKIGKLSKKYQSVVLFFSICAYVTMSILVNMIATDSLAVMQTAIIISWLFIMICLISVIVAVMINTRYLSQKRELSVISLTNDLMEKNYIQISQQQQQVSKLLHDFTNHLKTIDQLLLTNSSAKEYVQNLLTDVSEPLQLCQSGNKIIDAVINCKNEEAIRNRIQFSYQIRLSDHPLQITSTDLCALLANQIDNAIEACQKIADIDKRHIFISIWQREAFVFFRVINSASVNPLDENRKIKSVSSSKGELHGFGIKNIHDIAQRYNGTLEMSYADGNFTSIAILQSIE